VPSSGVTAMNFSPNPSPDFACCTAASALICPSWTRKSSLTVAPTVRGPSVSRNKPFALRSRTRETSSRPLQRQHTQTSSRVLTRELSLLAYAGFSNDFIIHLCPVCGAVCGTALKPKLATCLLTKARRRANWDIAVSQDSGIAQNRLRSIPDGQLVSEEGGYHLESKLFGCCSCGDRLSHFGVLGADYKPAASYP
jgi:hypothetical protein